MAESPHRLETAAYGNCGDIAIHRGDPDQSLHRQRSATQQFTATGTYSDNTTANITSTVTWTSATTATATITSTGLATGVAVGTSNITASLSGVTSPADLLTVTAATLQSIAVTPTSPSIAKGATQQFTATGTYSDNSTANISNSVTWNSATTVTATINSTGLATGVQRWHQPNHRQPERSYLAGSTCSR